MADHFPSEIMYNIFSRMPVKTLARFRCVSKQWCNYINDSYLETMLAKRAAVDDPMLIMIRQSSSWALPNASCKLRFLEYNKEEEEQKKGSCISTLKVRKKPWPVMKFMCKGLRLRYPNDIVLGSCNGLLYSSRAHHGYNTILVVINPLRKECYELPPIRPTRQYSRGVYHVEESYGLGFDDSTNTFKMVSVVNGEENGELCTMVHDLGSNSSWRKIPQVVPSYPITGGGVFANGCLHWLVEDEDLEIRPVVTFDMKKEEFGLINPPQETPYCGRIREQQLIDLDGEVGYVYHTVKRSMEVWVLKERGWVVHCVIKYKRPLPRCSLTVLGFWNRNGDVLMRDYHWNRTFVYSLRNDSLYEVGLVGRRKVLRTGDIRMYRSSLFTTRYSIKK